MKKIIFILMSMTTLFLFSGCTSKVANIKPLDTKVNHIYQICIEKNDKVIVHDFLPFVIEQFKKHNIKSKIYNEKIPNSCSYGLQYSAHKYWDVVMYFKAASLEIYHKDTLIASVKYESQNGLDVSKYGSMEKKFTPLIDELLKGHTPPSEEEMLARKEEHNLGREPAIKQSNLENKLAVLKKMSDNGTITNGEYANKREQLLNDY